MATVYRASDVLLTPSRAEGFGFPVVEAQACGIPVITQRAHAHQEININGDFISTVQRQWIPSLEYFWNIPDVPAIAEALDYYYDNGTDPREAQAARDLLRSRYSHENVWQQHWQPFIEQVEAQLW